jgi:hypothetical protein
MNYDEITPIPQTSVRILTDFDALRDVFPSISQPRALCFQVRQDGKRSDEFYIRS